jgi:hypothetical protein
MRWHWSGVVRLFAITIGLAAAAWDKFVLGGGWIPTVGLAVLCFLAVPITFGLVLGIRDRLYMKHHMDEIIEKARHGDPPN